MVNFIETLQVELKYLSSDFLILSSLIFNYTVNKIYRTEFQTLAVKLSKYSRK